MLAIQASVKQNKVLKDNSVFVTNTLSETI